MEGFIFFQKCKTDAGKLQEVDNQKNRTNYQKYENVGSTKKHFTCKQNLSQYKKVCEFQIEPEISPNQFIKKLLARVVENLDIAFKVEDEIKENVE